MTEGKSIERSAIDELRELGLTVEPYERYIESVGASVVRYRVSSPGIQMSELREEDLDVVRASVRIGLGVASARVREMAGAFEEIAKAAKITHHLDETDAWQASHYFFEPLEPRDRPCAYEMRGLCMSDGHMVDGGVKSLWVGFDLRALAIVLRDDANRSVLICVDAEAAS